MGSIPSVPTFPAGQVVTSAGLNELCTAITWCLTGRPVCLLQQTGSQVFSNSTATAVTWDTVLTDRDGGHSVSVNPSRYTAQTPGIYLLAANLPWAGVAAGARYCIFRMTTGSGNPAGSGVTLEFAGATLTQAGTFTASVASMSLTPYLYVGDYVEVIGFQASGGALDLQALKADQGPPYWSITLVSG